MFSVGVDERKLYTITELKEQLKQLLKIFLKQYELKQKWSIAT